MEDNTCKFEIKIDPIDMHIGLKDQMAEFESLIRMLRPGVSIAEKIEKDLKSRYCNCCFFGHVKGEIMGEPLCEECAKALYGFDENERHPRIRRIDPYYQLWYRRQKALPIFEAYLHAELERYKLEQKLEDAKATTYAESVDAGMEIRRMKRALWLARAKAADEAHFMWCQFIYDKKYGIVKFNVRKDWGENVKQGQTLHTPQGWADVWDDVERKCRAKAEEYK